MIELSKEKPNKILKKCVGITIALILFKFLIIN